MGVSPRVEFSRGGAASAGACVGGVTAVVSFVLGGWDKPDLAVRVSVA